MVEGVAMSERVKAAASVRSAVLDIEDLPTTGWRGKETYIRSQLLSWYARHRRHLPWRGDPPPWSEDKAGRKRKADEEEREQGQSKIASFFKKSLKPPSTPDHLIDLDNGGIVAIERGAQPEATSASERIVAEPSVAGFKPSAYGTWVSEVMLQQTQVERVIAYWTRWMTEFPTLQDLAAASSDAVNAVWAGLGFYGRAKRLHEGAKYVQKVHDGNIPSELESLKAIPGVGPYTAGAISSIAFGRRSAVVDGNVIRVFARLQALEGDANAIALQKKCWLLADELVDAAQPGNFNQALMELGATVCTPQSPACSRCPLRSQCSVAELAALGKAQVTDYPAKPKKKGPRLRSLALASLQDTDGRWLFVRRPDTGLLAGQWDFPSIELVTAETSSELTADASSNAAAQLLAVVKSLLQKFDDDLILLTQCPPVEHTFSHERHTMYLFGITAPMAAAKVVSGEGTVSWMSRSEAEHAGITSGIRKVLAALESRDNKVQTLQPKRNHKASKRTA
eukprot:TRINITY_DN31061_c0_g1_i1.p1 TRINITY_DN31061_c0_g1~~TRINITY_DN31061_c0_g1_i1.p1  ORF type:complete len:516 (-),score=31.99 TRINITY_DN31061_c0_g1_i1:225-1751(-)